MVRSMHYCTIAAEKKNGWKLVEWLSMKMKNVDENEKLENLEKELFI